VIGLVSVVRGVLGKQCENPWLRGEGLSWLGIVGRCALTECRVLRLVLSAATILVVGFEIRSKNRGPTGKSRLIHWLHTLPYQRIHAIGREPFLASSHGRQAFQCAPRFQGLPVSLLLRSSRPARAQHTAPLSRRISTPAVDNGLRLAP
jgi:hypothetical protein